MLFSSLSAKSVSLVSRWLNDGVLATERQMRFFVKEFGEQLKRKSEHLLTIKQDDKHFFIKLTGDLIVKHALRERVCVNRKQLNIAIHRFLIFRKGDNYYIVSQSRKGFDSKYALDNDSLDKLSHCDSEDANWVSKGAPKLLSLEELIQHVDSLALDLAEGRFSSRNKYVYSGQELQFSIRRYLMREGIHLPDVIDISTQN
tara:strand:+ start:36344 stop:36946 length:603 start_codon:yes stop_codon:yes gene_type:complete